MEIQVLVFMSEIKFDLILNKKGYNISKRYNGRFIEMVGIIINKVDVDFYLLFLSASNMG